MKRIAIVAGGYSAEAEISLKSAETVFNNLDRSLFDPYIVTISKNAWAVKTPSATFPIEKGDFSFVKDGRKITFDAVFIAIHGEPGEDGRIQGYFDLLNIPYSTPGVMVSSLTFNKAVTNQLLSHYGFNVAEAKYVFRGDHIQINAILNAVKLPCFVKPNEAGSSYGITKVTSKEQLVPAIEIAFKHNEMCIIESFLDGTEVTCGVHNIMGEVQALPVTEIVSENEFFDYEAKYEGKSQEITPARISDDLTLHIQATSKQIFRQLRLDCVARVDYIICDDEPYIIEVNTVPGLSKASIIPQMVTAAGIDHKDFFTAWVKKSFDS